ncbi:thiopurine S-methyltransferase-like [Diadema setosum]|uniref:thiopurine S-methyltransferase-like n=1 Tax=Diadema setosum TaxID=31175 RepID=UPI003B3B20BD
MSSSADITSSDKRVEEGAQPNPKRRKSSSANSFANGHNRKGDSADTSATPATVTTKPKSTPTDSNFSERVASSSATYSGAEAESVDTTPSAMAGTVPSNSTVNGTVQVDGDSNLADSERRSTNGDSQSTAAGQSLRRNQFGEVSDGHMSLDDWLEQWRRGKTRFTMKVPHRMLVKHIGRLVEGRTKPSFFVPCCGKTLDLKWLADKGYSVTGVEIAETACRQFFEEHDLQFTVEDVDDHVGGSLFKAVDCDVRIYCCDFFKITSDLIGQFDCIWDRGSYAAMNPSDRPRYCDVISKLLHQKGSYLLDCFELEHSVFAGPPHNAPPGEVERLFDSFVVEQIEHVDAMTDWTRSWGVEYFFENDFIIKHKSE